MYEEHICDHRVGYWERPKGPKPSSYILDTLTTQVERRFSAKWWKYNLTIISNIISRFSAKLHVSQGSFTQNKEKLSTKGKKLLDISKYKDFIIALFRKKTLQ